MKHQVSGWFQWSGPAYLLLHNSRKNRFCGPSHLHALALSASTSPCVSPPTLQPPPLSSNHAKTHLFLTPVSISATCAFSSSVNYRYMSDVSTSTRSEKSKGNGGWSESLNGAVFVRVTSAVSCSFGEPDTHVKEEESRLTKQFRKCPKPSRIKIIRLEILNFDDHNPSVPSQTSDTYIYI